MRSATPGWSRFRHARRAVWRTTASFIRRGSALEHRESHEEREARLQLLSSLAAEGAEPPPCRSLDAGCGGSR